MNLVNNLGDTLMQAEFDYHYKLALIGDSGVGKSCLLLRFCNDTYTESYISTIGHDFMVKTLNNFGNSGKTVKLQIWDFAGQERFRQIPGNYYRPPNGFLVVYDVTDMISFQNAKQWIEEVRSHNESYNVVRDIILVGAKGDLVSQKAVDLEVGKDFAKKMGIPFVETSSKNSIGVDEAFFAVTREILKRNVPDTKVEKVDDLVKQFLEEIHVLKDVLRKDCEGLFTLHFDRKTAGYKALEDLEKNLNSNYVGDKRKNPSAFIISEIAKIREKHIGIEGGIFNDVKALFTKYTDPKTQSTPAPK